MQWLWVQKCRLEMAARRCRDQAVVLGVEVQAGDGSPTVSGPGSGF
eukprot:CAMPEP_0204310974 /NCGR_PEP_ID=MMETSP0469-20131031/2053_1 /ASSEMBLY_ACC=CAM_ASM_000384 /TAXON_ID=2969 /ORGANISM="Oxyrrhis marina" /LENGTH=45 /DNA_ID= /DNA_START= /DNA_END= /DNA_ORIENTATION=